MQRLVAFLEARLGLTATGGILLSCSVAGWLAARAIGSRALFFLVYGVVAVVVIVAVLGRRRPAVDAERSQLPTRVREGQRVEVELRMVARRRLSTVTVADLLPAQLGTTVRVPIPLLPAGQEVTHGYSFQPRLRGVYSVGPLVATWSDPFGLTTRRTVLAEEAEIIVHPSTELAHDRVLSREWEDPPIRPPVSKPWPSGFEFYGMRDYTSGDDPRRIVWRATARTLDAHGVPARYLVRESEQGITDRVSLLIDTDRRHHSPGAPSDTFETAVRVIASLGVRHLRDGFAVTLETNGGRPADALRGRRNQIPFLDAMARVQPERIPLTTMIERLWTSPRRDTHLVLATPHLEVDAATRLRLLLDRGISLLLVILGWEDSDPVAVHRAGALGCNVVEVDASTPLEGVFAHVVGGGMRR
jgi:uncharacterized protein (DUF58 family)